MAKRPGEVVVPLSRNVSVRTRVKEKEAIYERSRVNVTVERGSTFTFMLSEFQACPSPPPRAFVILSVPVVGICQKISAQGQLSILLETVEVVIHQTSSKMRIITKIRIYSSAIEISQINVFFLQ